MRTLTQPLRGPRQLHINATSPFARRLGRSHVSVQKHLAWGLKRVMLQPGAVKKTPPVGTTSCNAGHERDSSITGRDQPGASLDTASSRYLEYINESTKFGVSAAAFGTLLYYHNPAACWALTGSILNAVVGKLLKRALNVPRPGLAPKKDPGMPSSHALSLGYLATTAAACLFAARVGWEEPGLGVAAAVALQLLGLALAALRVTLGFHTVDQVRTLK